jgi:hypothetical protein
MADDVTSHASYLRRIIKHHQECRGRLVQDANEAPSLETKQRIEAEIGVIDDRIETLQRELKSQ